MGQKKFQVELMGCKYYYLHPISCHADRFIQVEPLFELYPEIASFYKMLGEDELKNFRGECFFCDCEIIITVTLATMQKFCCNYICFIAFHGCSDMLPCLAWSYHIFKPFPINDFSTYL